jgi:putative addiction module CopG family antidote
MHVSLPASLEEFVRPKVAEGPFESPDDVVCQGLRLLQQQEQWQADARQKIDESWQQAKAGQLRTPEQIRESLAGRKAAWRSQRGGK